MRVLPVQDDLPLEPGHVTVEGVEAITFDFGNTLVPVSRAALERVVALTADAVCGRWADLDRERFLVAWAEERDRQFLEEVPQFREVDLAQRLVRVFARLRGSATPHRGDPWDDADAGQWSEPSDVEWAVERYSRAFVDGLPPDPAAARLLAVLSAEHELAILSNWPLAATIDRYAEAHGWLSSLRAIVVSQRVGTIKPHPAIFAVARAELGNPPPAAILHVGDDWAADVVGAAAVGWRTAWIANRPGDSPLPSSERDGALEPDILLTGLGDLEEEFAARSGPASDPVPSAGM